jgi:hypothetical protein
MLRMTTTLLLLLLSLPCGFSVSRRVRRRAKSPLRKRPTQLVPPNATQLKKTQQQ